ncbi:MAG: hypothetical protein KF718_27850 [Polyangiaceae bacterium]|nr:hypothetical protein [Polyangiaceae bacterium]
MTKKNEKPTHPLLDDAHREGRLSRAALDVLQLPDLGAQIQAGLGVSVDDVDASEVLLVTLMPDDSSSIQFAGNAGALRDGHNLVLDALAQSRQMEDVLVHTRYLNGFVLFPYVTLSSAVRMDGKNYRPNQGTPLFDQTLVVLATVAAKAQELQNAGVAVRTVTLLLTDGSDQHSTRATAADVRAVVQDLTRDEHHVICAMGIADGSTDFRAVFSDMGIPDRWILTPGNSASEIRKAFQVFSQSAARVSAGGLGGFMN